MEEQHEADPLCEAIYTLSGLVGLAAADSASSPAVTPSTALPTASDSSFSVSQSSPLQAVSPSNNSPSSPVTGSRNNATAAATGLPASGGNGGGSCAAISKLYVSQKARKESPIVPAQLAYECMTSVPFQADAALALLDDLQVYLEWQSNLAWVAAPPSEYEEKVQPAYDFQATYEQIRANATKRAFSSEYEFEFTLYRAIQQVHDGHFVYVPTMLRMFEFGRNVPLVSVSDDPSKLPQLYAFSDIMDVEMTKASYEPSAVTKINGQDPTDFLQDLSDYSAPQDKDAMWNSLFWSNAQVALGGDGTGIGVFAGGARGVVVYPGPYTNLTFANGSISSTQNFAMVTAPYMTNVTDAHSFYTQNIGHYWNGNYPPFKRPTSSTSASSMSPSTTSIHSMSSSGSSSTMTISSSSNDHSSSTISQVVPSTTRSADLVGDSTKQAPHNVAKPSGGSEGNLSGGSEGDGIHSQAQQSSEHSTSTDWATWKPSAVSSSSSIVWWTPDTTEARWEPSTTWGAWNSPVVPTFIPTLAPQWTPTPNTWWTPSPSKAADVPAASSWHPTTSAPGAWEPSSSHDDGAWVPSSVLLSSPDNGAWHPFTTAVQDGKWTPTKAVARAAASRPPAAKDLVRRDGGNSTASSGNSTSPSNISSQSSGDSSSPQASKLPTPGYPKPVVDNPVENANSGYFLDGSDYDDVAVLALRSFADSGNDAWSKNYQETNKEFLAQAVKSGKKKLIIDLSANPGGNILLAYDLFKQLFPSKTPDGLTRWRAHEALQLLGTETSNVYYNDEKAWAQLNSDNSSIRMDEENVWDFKQGMSDKDVPFTSWDQKYGMVNSGPGNQKYTSLIKVNLTDALTRAESGNITVTGYGPNNGTGLTQPFAAEDIIMVYDGFCASSCTIFSYMMREQAQIRSIALGGRPTKDIIQAVGGTKGAQSEDMNSIYGSIVNMQNIVRYQLIDQWSDTVMGNYTDLPLLSGTATGSINVADQIRFNDKEQIPRQFIYEPADCRIYYNRQMVVDQTAVWKTVADTMWGGRQNCVAGSLSGGNSTNSTSSVSARSPTLKARTAPRKHMVSRDLDTQAFLDSMDLRTGPIRPRGPGFTIP